MEKRSKLTYFAGWLFLVGSVFGLLFSLSGLVLLWTTRQEVTSQLTGTLALVGRTLDATSTSIQVITSSLDRASQNLMLMSELISDVGGTLEDSKTLIDTTAGMVGSDLKGFVAQTQESLVEVQESARVVDSALRVIDSTQQFLNRFRPGAPVYSPRTPLQESVAEVNKSLDPLPESFDNIQTQLEISAGHAATMQAEVEALAKEVNQIETNLEDARAEAKEYRLIIDDLQQKLEQFNKRLPLVINLVYLSVTLFLVWMVIVQVAMLLHGLGVITS